MDETSTVLSSATDQTEVEYTIPLVRDDLQGLQYTCRAVAGDTIYTETVQIQVVGKSMSRKCCVKSFQTITTLHVPHSLAVPAGSVEVETEVVSGEGPVEAGSRGPTLTCTVRETISGLTNMPSALWVGPSGSVEDGESVTLTGTTSDVTATLTLTFPSLLTSQAGGYTCQGTVVTQAGVDDVTITSTPPNYVTVSCKYQRMHGALCS